MSTNRHSLVVGAIGALLLTVAVLIGTSGVSGATTARADSAAVLAGGGHDCHDHRGGHRSVAGGNKGDKGHKHKKPCKPEDTTSTEAPPTSDDTTSTEAPPTSDDTTSTEAPPTSDETTSSTDEVPEVESETSVADEDEPVVLGESMENPEVQAAELAFTGSSTARIVTAGAGALLLGLALVSISRRRRQV